MGPSSQSLFFLSLALALISLTSLCSSFDTTDLMFKGCADQNFQDSDGNTKQALKTLLDTLVSQSSSAKFYKSSSGADAAAVDGLFQCRGDLSNGACEDCVKRIPGLAQRICGQAIAARVQLDGCYLRYEVSGFRQVSGTELLYKVCGSNRASGSGFGDRLDSALGEIAKGVVNGGYYASAYQSVNLLGQCQGDLSGGDCVSCVKSAIDKAKSECGSSISARIYLQQCYITYSYSPNGVATNQQPHSPSVGLTGKNTQKTVALVLGGLVGVGLIMACLLFTRSALKKKQQNVYKFGGNMAQNPLERRTEIDDQFEFGLLD